MASPGGTPRGVLPCLHPPVMGTLCCGCWGPAESRPCCSRRRSPQGASPHRHPNYPSTHPHLPAPPGCRGAGWGRWPPETPPCPSWVSVPCVGGAAGTLGCSSLGRAGVLGSIGCMLCMLLSGWDACCAPTAQLGGTQHTTEVHPPPNRGAPPLSRDAHHFLAGSLLSGQDWEHPGLCGPVQVPFPTSPRSPGSSAVSPPAQGRRGRAQCMLLARRQLSALGTSRFPASAAKEPSLPKLLRAAETVPGKASTRARPPSSSNVEPRLGSEPPPSPSLGLSSPHRPQPLHPVVTRAAWHLVPAGAASPLQGPVPRCGMRGEAWGLHWAGVMGTVPWRWPSLAEPGAVRTQRWSPALGWCRGMPRSCPAGIPVFSLGFPLPRARSWRVRASPPPARPRGGCWGPLLDRKGIWCCFLSTPTPWSSQPHWKHMCPGWGKAGRVDAMLPPHRPRWGGGAGSSGCPGCWHPRVLVRLLR